MTKYWQHGVADGSGRLVILRHVRFVKRLVLLTLAS